MTASADGRHRFLVNVGSSLALTGLSALLMLLYIPFLIRNLGLAAYGLIAFAHLFVNYAALVTDGVFFAIERYLTIALKRSSESARNTFSTAMVVALFEVAVLVPLVAVIAWFLPAIVSGASSESGQSHLLIACIGLHFVLSIVENVFAISTTAMQRFDLRNCVRAVALVVRLGTTCLCIITLGGELWQVGLGFVLSGLVSLAGSWWLCRRLTPELYFQPAGYDSSLAAKLTRFGGWSTINRLGMLFLITSDMVLLSWLFGASVIGVYAALVFIPELIRNLVGAVASVISPNVISRYAIGDHAGLIEYVARSIRLIGLALALPVGIICGLAEPLLTAWLGREFAGFGPMLVLMTLPLCLNLATLPAAYLLTSYNKIKVQALTTLSMGLATSCLAWLAASKFELGALGVILINATGAVIRNGMFLPIYSARVSGHMRPARLLMQPIAGLLWAIAIAVLAYTVSGIPLPEGLFMLAVRVLAVAAVGGALIIMIGLNASERALLLGSVPRYLPSFVANR